LVDAPNLHEGRMDLDVGENKEQESDRVPGLVIRRVPIRGLGRQFIKGVDHQPSEVKKLEAMTRDL
jgi:hypothetical protein